MIPGNYSVVRVLSREDSDGPDTECISFGHDTLAQARAALLEFAGSEGISKDDLAVCRLWQADPRDDD